MSENIIIVKAGKNSKEGARLNGIALDYMAYSLVGSKDSKVIEKTLKKLWGLKRNRFSYQYAYEAKLEGKTVGIITCYPYFICIRQVCFEKTKKGA